MIVNFKYFYEKSDINYIEYTTLWTENYDRMIFLNKNLSQKQQLLYIINNITNSTDILAIRFPSNKFIKQNKIIKNIMLGKGVIYADNKIWYPKEVWIYSPIN